MKNWGLNDNNPITNTNNIYFVHCKYREAKLRHIRQSLSLRMAECKLNSFEVIAKNLESFKF